MKKYIFILGRDHELSILELVSYFKARGIKNKILEFNDKIALIDLENLDFKKIINDIGGIVKIAKVIFEEGNLNKFYYNYLGSKNKISYGISLYGKVSFADKFLGRIKIILKEQKLKAMKKQGSTKELDPSDVINLDLEFVLYKNFIGETIAVFNPKEYKERDKRPVNDFLKSTSIRLSKIMINLSQVKENETLLDPFCGTGIILQEALLKNLNVVGVDLDKWSVNASKKNLDWLKEKYNLKNSFKVIQGDSTELNKFLKENVGVIVTEPYLGPFLKDLPSYNEAIEVANELKKLYFDFLNSVKNIVSKRIVIIVPFFTTKDNKKIDIGFDDIARKNGFLVENIFKGIKIPIFYSEDKTRLDRKIYVLTKI